VTTENSRKTVTKSLLIVFEVNAGFVVRYVTVQISRDKTYVAYTQRVWLRILMRMTGPIHNSSGN
jgi:hypothetical protein